MSISDEMMENYFTLLTNLSAERITELVNPDKTHPKEAKVFLGKIIIKQFYNEAAADAAAAEFEKVFAQNQLPSERLVVSIPSNLASTTSIVISVFDVSSSEAKRMIKQGGVKIDGEKASDPNSQIEPKNGMVIQFGKRIVKEIKIEK
jgi:tyrosyl-tRNA synthetase